MEAQGRRKYVKGKDDGSQTSFLAKVDTSLPRHPTPKIYFFTNYKFIFSLKER